VGATDGDGVPEGVMVAVGVMEGVPLPVAVPERVGDAPVEKLADALVVAVCGGRRGRGRK
jgi:hypothetical protein